MTTVKRNVTVTVQGRLLQATAKATRPEPDESKKPAPKRGRVTTFSKKSRKRLLDLNATVDMRSGRHTFVTLTYPDECLPVTPQDSYNDHLRPLLERFRRAYPEMAVLWRKEIKIRQTGKYAGLPAPHYHLILYNAPYIERDDLRKAWMQIVSANGWEHLQVDIRRIVSARQLTSYVSKYVAKKDDVDLYAVWLALTGPARDVLLTYLDTVPYLHAMLSWVEKFGDLDWLPGRLWGISNKAKMPLCERFSVTLRHLGRSYRDLRRYARHVWSGVRHGHDVQGFTVYIDNAQRWWDCVLHCILDL